MRTKNFLATAALTGTTLLFWSAPSLAELYVSPVVRGTVSMQGPGNDATHQVRGRSSVHGDFSMTQKEGGNDDLMRFGKNVPMFVALEHMVPSSSWDVHIEDGLENKAVSWEGGQSWEGVLKAIESANDVYIVVNQQEMTVGVGSTYKIADGMAHKTPRVWKLVAGMSLRDNLINWGSQAGWKVAWRQDLPDYPVDHSVVLIGDFAGEDGVVDRIFAALAQREVPLTAKFYTGNQVVEIVDAGYEQEVKY